MHEQVKTRIKSSICSRDKWVLDKEVSNCFRCDKKFNPIFLRKHHCRICGHIFCASCSEYFLGGEEYDLAEKQIRMCELCNKKMLRYINEHEMPKEPKVSAEKDEGSSSKSKALKDDREQHLKDLIEVEEDEPLEFANIKQKAKEKISLLIQIMLKENKVPFEYYEHIQKLILRVVKDIPPNAMTTGNMNICKNIKVTKIRHEDLSQSKYIVGTVVVLNAFSKKIASKYNNVRVMLVYGGMELSDIMGSESSFEALLENRRKELSNLVYILVVILGVNVIFVQKNVEKEVIDLLHENSITVISKVKISNLMRLKHSLEIKKIVDRISRIKDYNEEDIMGMCKSMYLEKMGVFPEDNKNFLIVEGEKATNGLTICLSGPDETVLKRIKKEIKPLFMAARHIYLKLSAIIFDQKLMHSIKTEWRKSGYPNLMFKMFNDKHVNTAGYIRQNYLTYKRLVFVESDFCIFPDIPKECYLSLSKSKRRFQSKWQHFTQICSSGGHMKDQNRRFYSEDDWPLGEYLLKKLLNLERRCEHCQQPGYKHIEMYYGQNMYVKVEVEARIIEERNSQKIELEETDFDSVFERLAKRKEKHKIQQYVECQDCQQQLSCRFYVKEEHLEMSLLGFLWNIFSSTNYSRLRPYSPSSTTTCRHERMCRVFQLGDSFMKVYTGFLIQSPKYQLSPEQFQGFIDEKDLKHVKEVCMLQYANIEKIVQYLQEELKIFSDLTKSADFEAILKNPKASIIKAKTSFVRNSTLTQSQCMEILIPEILEQIHRVEAAADTLLASKKVQSHCEAEFNYKMCVNILARIANVISAMKRSAQKRELNQKYTKLEEETGELLENFDVNELMDGKESELSVRERVGSHITNHTEKLTLTDEGSEDLDSTKHFENWFSMQQGEPLNRKYRKSETSFPAKKESKSTLASVEPIFKYAHCPYKYEKTFVQFLTPSPYVPQSMIAAALNTTTHCQVIKSSSNLNSLDNIRIKFVEGDNSELANDFEDLKKIYTLVQVQERMMQIQRHKKIPMIEVNILYPQMFEKIRAESDIDINLYINTITGVDAWISNGGKSGSPFMRAHNDLVIIKKISEREFHCFKKILPEYLKHLEEGSLLTPIFGGYEVIGGARPEYFIVMQNLFFGMTNWQIYDFKGSRTKRFSKPQVIPLDINYIIDRNSEPLFTASNVLADLGKTLEFLSVHNIIDYSLVLVIDILDPLAETLDGFPIKLGVIDYLREYGGLEKIETVIKGLKGNETTVIGAIPYKDRMMSSVSRYFCTLPH